MPCPTLTPHYYLFRQKLSLPATFPLFLNDFQLTIALAFFSNFKGIFFFKTFLPTRCSFFFIRVSIYYTRYNM